MAYDLSHKVRTPWLIDEEKLIPARLSMFASIRLPQVRTPSLIAEEKLTSATGWFPTEMTTGGSDAANMSAPQEDGEFQKEMETIGARVPPGRMGNAQDLASVSCFPEHLYELPVS